MAEQMSLQEAVAEMVQDGQVVALEGFTHLIPFAAGHEIIRQQRSGLTLVRMTPDLIYDQLIGMGCARKLVFSWGGNPGVGSLHRFRDAVEQNWPAPLELDERSHGAMAAAYAAGASRLPFGLVSSYAGTQIEAHNPNIRSLDCPFTGRPLAAVRALRPDVGIIHAQQADRRGNVLLWGIIGIQKEVVLASGRTIATVEEIVPTLQAPPNATVLPHWVIDCVCRVPGGAYPSYAHGYYERDNRFYREWDPISRDRKQFREWMQRHVLSTADFDEFRASLKTSRS